jgi:tetratricopeptide (TPR) repeat protein
MARVSALLAIVVPMFAACGPATPQPQNAGNPEPVPSASAQPKSSDDTLVRDAIKRGEAAVKAGDFKGAKDIFQGVLDRRAGNPRALYYLGVCNENLGDKTAAEKFYRDALAKAPELGDAALNLSAMLMDLGRTDDAIKVLRAGIEKTPSDPMLHANLGHALSKSGDKAGAAAEYRLALKLGEDDATRLALASTLAASGKKDEALVELKKVADTSRKREVLATVGDALSRLGAYGECVAAYDRAIKIEVAAQLYVQRGICRRELKDDDGSKKDFESATKADPKYAPGWYYLGVFWMGQKNNAEALKALEKAKQLAPNSKAAERIAEIKKGKNK